MQTVQCDVGKMSSRLGIEYNHCGTCKVIMTFRDGNDMSVFMMRLLNMYSQQSATNSIATLFLPVVGYSEVTFDLSLIMNGL